MTTGPGATVLPGAREPRERTSAWEPLGVAAAWAAVPLWLLVTLDGPGPFASGLLLAALVSLPALLATAVVAVRGLLRLGRRPSQHRPRTGTALRVALAVHVAAVASFPLAALARGAVDDRRAGDLLAGLEADAVACARLALADHPRAGERAPAEVAQDPARLARTRTEALSAPAEACLRSRRADVRDCLTGPVCSVDVPEALAERGGLVVDLGPALRAEHDRQVEVARAGDRPAPAPLDLGGLRDSGPAARFAF